MIQCASSHLSALLEMISYWRAGSVVSVGCRRPPTSNRAGAAIRHDPQIALRSRSDFGRVLMTIPLFTHGLSVIPLAASNKVRADTIGCPPLHAGARAGHTEHSVTAPPSGQVGCGRAATLSTMTRASSLGPSVTMTLPASTQTGHRQAA